jgi:hypothetical protein
MLKFLVGGHRSLSPQGVYSDAGKEQFIGKKLKKQRSNRVCMFIFIQIPGFRVKRSNWATALIWEATEPLRTPVFAGISKHINE